MSAGGEGVSRALLDVMEERRRQIEVEGFNANHDAEHRNGELAAAAAAYAYAASLPELDRAALRRGDSFVCHIQGVLWPRAWAGWWKPKDRRRDLVRSAALAIAAIEQIDRRPLS